MRDDDAPVKVVVRSASSSSQLNNGGSDRDTSGGGNSSSSSTLFSRIMTIGVLLVVSLFAEDLMEMRLIAKNTLRRALYTKDVVGTAGISNHTLLEVEREAVRRAYGYDAAEGEVRDEEGNDEDHRGGYANDVPTARPGEEEEQEEEKNATTTTNNNNNNNQDGAHQPGPDPGGIETPRPPLPSTVPAEPAPDPTHPKEEEEEEEKELFSGEADLASISEAYAKVQQDVEAAKKQFGPNGVSSSSSSSSSPSASSSDEEAASSASNAVAAANEQHERSDDEQKEEEEAEPEPPTPAPAVEGEPDETTTTTPRPAMNDDTTPAVTTTATATTSTSTAQPDPRDQPDHPDPPADPRDPEPPDTTISKQQEKEESSGYTGEADLASISEAYAKMLIDVEAAKHGVVLDEPEDVKEENEPFKKEMEEDKDKDKEEDKEEEAKKKEGESEEEKIKRQTDEFARDDGKPEPKPEPETHTAAEDDKEKEKSASAPPREGDADFLGFTALERDMLKETVKNDTHHVDMSHLNDDLVAYTEKWIDQWQCLPDEAHRYDESPYNDHCSIPEKQKPEWMRRDPIVEAIMSSGGGGGGGGSGGGGGVTRALLPTQSVDGLRLAAAFRGKRVLFNGDSIVEQLVRAWSCDLRGVSGANVDLGPKNAEEGKELETFMDFVKKNEASDPSFIGSTALDNMLYGKKNGEEAGDGGGGGGSLSVFRLGDRKIKDWMESDKAFHMMKDVDVIILHFGLHYHEEARMREEYEMLMPKLNEFAAQPGKVAMILEIGSQHFAGSPSGQYEDRNPMTKDCYCAPNKEDAVDKLDRNKIISEYLAKYPNVKLIPFRSLTKPRFATHMKRRRLKHDGCDCTHWCYSAPFWRATMGGIMDAIEGKEGFPSSSSSST